MTPRNEQSASPVATTHNGDTIVIEHVDEPSFVMCTSKEPFCNPTSPSGLTATQVNETLNLNLGLGIVPENQLLRKIIRWMQAVSVMWWEQHLFTIIRKLPLSFRKWACMTGWHIYYAVHKRLLGRRPGIHPAASEEYHALTSIMYWGRICPVNIPRMRFALSQLSAWTDNTVTSKVDIVDCIMDNVMSNEQTDGNSFSNRVKGLYVHSGRTNTYVERKKVIFWLYGGAYLSGDTYGNLSPAEQVGKACGADVFLVDYTLIPEAKFDAIVWDVCLAYYWLVVIKGNVDPSDVILYGISSGAGLAARMMQLIAKHKRGDDGVAPACLSQLFTTAPQLTMPSGAVLLCPFVDYSEPDPDGSFLQYAKHDLIVNQSVQEVGLPYFDIALGTRRKECSPCFDDCTDLPPLCVIVSEHETVYDQTLLLVNRARAAGVPVTVGVWKYMCHVFCMLGAFAPEGRQSMAFANDWIVRHIMNNNNKTTTAAAAAAAASR